jgi:hypothetical protein
MADELLVAQEAISLLALIHPNHERSDVPLADS